eukprot:3072575-Rhodomonas_salina.3
MSGTGATMYRSTLACSARAIYPMVLGTHYGMPDTEIAICGSELEYGATPYLYLGCVRLAAESFGWSGPGTPTSQGQVPVVLYAYGALPHVYVAIGLRVWRNTPTRMALCCRSRSAVCQRVWCDSPASIGLRACDAESGTDMPSLCGTGYERATRCPTAGGSPTSLNSTTEPLHPVPAYGLAMECPVLRQQMLLSSHACACCGSYCGHNTALRARYAMSGTELAYGAICRRACYA